MVKPDGGLKKVKALSTGKMKQGTEDVSTEQAEFNSIQSKLSSSTDLNPLSDLIRLSTILSNDAFASEAKLKTLSRALNFLKRCLESLLEDQKISLGHIDDEGRLVGGMNTKGLSEADRVVGAWLRQRWNDSIDAISAMLSHNVESLRLLALRLLMELQAAASYSLSRHSSGSDVTSGTPQWSASPWRRIVTSVLVGTSFASVDGASSNPTFNDKTPPQDLQEAFAENYLEKFDDVRYAFCKEVSLLVSKPPPSIIDSSILRQRAFSTMLLITAIPTKVADLNTFYIKEFDSLPAKVGATRKGEVGGKRKRSGPFILSEGISGEKGEGGKEAKSGEDDDDDDESEEDMEDWFSDSDDEKGPGSSSKPTKKLEKRNESAGLGRIAEATEEARRSKRRLKQNPPFALAVHSLGAQKSMFSKAWLALLLPKRGADGQPLGGEVGLGLNHEALVRMHTQIMPHLVKPQLLHDFLVDCLEAGGATSLLALNALFTLITSHNLNYPSFYTRLYGLLITDPPFLHVRYRSRFLRMLDLFLSSTHLPAALVASFAKRLSRSALRAPPAAVVVVIPFVWNLLKRHKRCMGMIHREFEGDHLEQGPAGIEDPFDPLELDPLKTRAIDSSLWELASLGTAQAAATKSGFTTPSGGDAHYLGSVNSLAKILSEPFAKERYSLEDFLDMTYGTLFETETIKTLKPRITSDGRRMAKMGKEPALAFTLPRNSAGKQLPAFETEQLKKRQRQDVSGDAPLLDDGERGEEVEGGSEENQGQAMERTNLESQAGDEDKDEDEDVRNAKLAMREIEERDSSNHLERDACSRLWVFS